MILIISIITPETEGADAKNKTAEQSSTNKPIDFNIRDIQDILDYFKNVLEITDEDDILYHSLVVLIRDFDQNDIKPMHEYILNGKSPAKVIND